MTVSAAINTRFRSEILGLSMAEILLVFVLGLIAFTHFAQIEGRTAVEFKDKRIAELETRIQFLTEELDGMKSELRTKGREFERLAKMYSRLWEALKVAGVEVTLEPGGNPVIGLPSSSEEPNGDGAEQQLAELEKKLLEKNKIIAELLKRLEDKGGGRDKPRCQLSQTDTTTYLLDIEMSDEGFGVTRSWDKDSEREALEIPGVRELVQQGFVSAENFIREGKKINDWSRKREPECRFYVLLNDRTSGAFFKQRLGQVEAYFYKRLVN